MPRRLFLFAAYDPFGTVGASLLWHVSALSRLGKVVLYADGAFSSEELGKLSGQVLYAGASAHGEYDFGSYKRAWDWARASLDLGEFDYVYMVNDSVFGPLYELGPYLERMEALAVPAFGMVLNPHRRSPHLQSWFIGMGREVFVSDWFGPFLDSVEHQEHKEDVCIKYETGLTALLDARGIAYEGLYRLSGKKIYNALGLQRRLRLPFVKKASFTRHGGSLGAGLKRVLGAAPEACRRAVLEDVSRLYGEDYAGRLLTSDPFVIAWRYLAYLFRKLF